MPRTGDAQQKSLKHATTHFSKQFNVFQPAFYSFQETSTPKLGNDAKEMLS